MLHQNKKSGLGYRYITDHLATDTDSGTEGVNGVPDLDDVLRRRIQHLLCRWIHLPDIPDTCPDHESRKTR